MDSTRKLKDKDFSSKSSSKSKAFDHCIADLFDEIQLSVQWNRPSILLAVHDSEGGQEKAKKALQKKLINVSVDVVHVHPNSEASDLFHLIEQTDEPDRFVYFIEGVGMDQDHYRALNLYREKLVEKKIIAVFWLTEKEAMVLPRLAPDFWAFRHRVVEFASSRGSKRKVLPSGILMWTASLPDVNDASISEKIAAQENVLRQLPTTDDALVLRAEAAYTLAHYYWLSEKDEKAEELLRQELHRVESLPMPDIIATFLNGLTIVSYDRQNYDQALQFLEKAILLTPNDQVLLANLAVLQHGLGKSVPAIQTLKKAIKSFPSSSWFWYILGYIDFSLGRLDQALEAFHESIQTNAGNTFARYAIVVCQTRTENMVERASAIQLLERSQVEPSLHHAICMEALSGNKAVALDKLRFGLRSGEISPITLKRDPVFSMFFDATTMEFVL